MVHGEDAYRIMTNHPNIFSVGINLLPAAAKAELRLHYRLRLATVLFSVLGFVCCISAALLLPTYFAIRADADEAARYVAALTDLAAQRAQNPANRTLTIFAESIKLLGAADLPPVVGPAVATISGPLPNNVSVDRIELERIEGAVDITITGTAATRASLIAYVDGLKATPNLQQVSVPVSALVPEINAPFTVTARYTP